jgi:hypothetical protein
MAVREGGHEAKQASNILLLSPFFWPEPISTGRYNGLLAQALSRRGAKVRAICSHPMYPSWRPTRCEAQLPGITVLRGGIWVRYPKAIWARRMILELWFAFHAFCKTWRFRNEVSTIIAVFPPNIFFLLVSAILPKRIRSVGIVHDLQGVLSSTGSGWKQRLLNRLVQVVERRTFRCCDRLVFLSKEMKQFAVAAYGLKEKQCEVRYPFVNSGKRNAGGDNLSPMLPKGRVHVVYSGALGRKQNARELTAFFRVAAATIVEADFHIFSGGPSFDELSQESSARGDEHVFFHALVDERDLNELYEKSTVQIIPQTSASSHACLPSKLPNLLAAGCCVLAMCDAHSELAQIIEDAGTGVTANSWQTEILLEALKKAIVLASRSTQQERREQAAAVLSAKFSLDALIDSILGVSDARHASTRDGSALNAEWCARLEGD